MTTRSWGGRLPERGEIEVDIFKRLGTDNMPERWIERSRPMDEAQASAPDKDRPHPFQARPEIVAIASGGPAMLQETPGGPTCALCGAPRDARLHVEGKAEANQETPDWG
jgi:hypothetical protein